MTTVVLTGSRAPATLDLARRFADDGVRVVVADSQPAITSSSNAVDAAYRVPSPRFRPREFAAAVAGIAARHVADLVVPTCEETFWLAAAAAAPAAATSAVAGAASSAAAAVAASLAAPDPSSVSAPPEGREAAVALGQLLFAPPIEVLRRLHDKAEFAALLSELDLPHPATEVVDSAIDWRHRAQARERALDRGGTHAPARLVLKPTFSRFGTRTRVIEPHQPLPDLPRVTRHERWVLQEHVEGTEFCTYAVAIEGRLTAFVAYRPVWRAGRRGDTGAGVAFERLDPATAPVREARRIAARLAAALTLTGQFGLDLMHRPPRPGDAGAGAGARVGADAEARVVVLECNPRATSGIHLFASSDHLARAFLPHLARRPASPASPAVPSHEPEPEHGPESEPEATAAPSAPPIQASRATARLGLPHAMYPPLGPPVARALTFTRQLRYPDALRPPEDRLPLAALVRSLAVQLRESRRARVGLLAASTHDLEWNGESLRPEPSPADPGAEPVRPTGANRSTPDDGWAGALAAAVAEAGGVAAAVTNATAELRTVRVGDHELPLTVSTHRQRSTHRRSSTGHRGSTGRQGSTHRQPDDRPAQGTEQADAPPPSYVVSPFTHYVDYAREELGELTSASARRAAGLLLWGLGAILDAGRVDDIVLMGNGLVSTNLLPDAGERGVAEVTARLRREHPQRAIGWRSVHGRGMLLPETLRRSGYRLLPSRSVFFAPTRGDEWLGLRDVRRDRQLFEASGYEAVPAPIDPRTGASDLATRERIVELYRLLYLDKYSRLNPAYTPAFVAAAQRSGFLDFTLLVRRDAPVTTPGPDTTAGTGAGRIDGVMGTRTAHGFLAAPVFGYDTSLPPETGLYRMLSWLVARRAHDEGAELHASSGVADFKRHRGGEAELEYTAVYVRHLPWRRRLAWGVLETVLTRVAVPVLVRQGL
ncbi:ATP-grasp domain-containing protein [Herbiconiux sp. VKM Ac-1786]|uniref:ATP-grasp domain-containing protein n=1 Tax=Herbiconiux sp. VKM Ac-1786 TaxID=2783824 RepID=UPI001889CD59|nr:ATP-grasp domain-containing protein [Herbiconiux sp. VKM Ac-1786]MBF4573871.1 ATP-grasp domain-containing protein [Herbiconiux sp. VKM Ac-1786]